jgi:histone H3/H4
MANLIVKSEIKRVVTEFNVSGDVAPKLNELTEEILRRAEVRAEANGRKTVCARDL